PVFQAAGEVLELNVNHSGILARFDFLGVAAAAATNAQARDFAAIDVSHKAIAVIDHQTQLRDPVGLLHREFAPKVKRSGLAALSGQLSASLSAEIGRAHV